jgi:hypothetical protein
MRAIRDEATALSSQFEQAARAFSNDLRERWVLEEISGAEILLATAGGIQEERGGERPRTGRQDRARGKGSVATRGQFRLAAGAALPGPPPAGRVPDSRSASVADAQRTPGPTRPVVARHLHEQRNGDELVAGSDEQSRGEGSFTECERCHRALQRRHLVSARAGVTSRFLSGRCCRCRRGTRRNLPHADHGGNGGRTSRVL